MPPAKIPGYYFDESRGRYFKITNGAVPVENDASQKYHNNSVQAEKRNQHFDKVEKQEQKKHDKESKKRRHGQQVINNPRVTPFPPSDKVYQRLRRVEFDHLTLLGLKTGTIDLNKIYFKNDLIDTIRNGAKLEQNHIIPPQGTIAAYHKDYFIVAMTKYGDEQVLNMSVFTSSGKLFVPPQSMYCIVADGYQNLTKVGADDLFATYNQNPLHTRIYTGYNDTRSVSYILQNYEFFGEKHCPVLKFHTFSSIDNSFEDLTVPLMRFLKTQFSKCHKKIGNNLNKMFGLDSFQFTQSSSTSINEINSVLKSGASYFQVQSRLDAFLIAHDGPKPEYIYKPVERMLTSSMIATCDVVDSQIVAVTSSGQIVYFEYNPDLKKFQEFKLFTTRMSMEQPSAKLKGDFIYVKVGKEILAINYKEKQIERHTFDSLRHFFILSASKWLIVNHNLISYYYPRTKEFEQVMSYNHGNDTFQQFQLINNHLIFTTGSRFKVINLSRAIKDQVAVLEVEFETRIYGHFRNYRLHRIIDMGVRHGRTLVGFQFANPGRTHTRFESYYI
ncbi:hypothetical protein CANMA_001287 [Candida margitis]|uniref:uncharacterized protein n=1 Tax=Candida margitis TaxID=1775924 RepID=UPI002226E970|nr:uncharacterized protein CANMA_001287 [Candida margitis]KAI5969624.1 hypothetical protein CANMA_001287 [Candida margitis]